MKKSVKEMTIKEVLYTPEFRQIAKMEISKLWDSRLAFRANLKPGERLKRHPIDALHADGMLYLDSFIIEFESIINKNSTLTHSQRKVIYTLGMTSFNQVVKKFIEDEKERDRNDG